jgi:hypothetical protein
LLQLGRLQGQFNKAIYVNEEVVDNNYDSITHSRGLSILFRATYVNRHAHNTSSFAIVITSPSDRSLMGTSQMGNSKQTCCFKVCFSFFCFDFKASCLLSFQSTMFSFFDKEISPPKEHYSCNSSVSARTGRSSGGAWGKHSLDGLAMLDTVAAVHPVCSMTSRLHIMTRQAQVVPVANATMLQNFTQLFRNVHQRPEPVVVMAVARRFESSERVVTTAAAGASVLYGSHSSFRKVWCVVVVLRNLRKPQSKTTTSSCQAR